MYIQYFVRAQLIMLERAFHNIDFLHLKSVNRILHNLQRSDKLYSRSWGVQSFDIESYSFEKFNVSLIIPMTNMFLLFLKVHPVPFRSFL